MAPRFAPYLLVVAFLSAGAGAQAVVAEGEVNEEVVARYYETAVCGPYIDQLLDALAGELPPPQGPAELQSTLSAVLTNSYFDCPTEQMIAAAILNEGRGVPDDRSRAQTAFRKIAFYSIWMGSFESTIAFSERYIFVTDELNEAGSWVESLNAMTVDELLAEARYYAVLDDELAKYLERLAAANGSKEAMRLAGRRVAAEDDFENEQLLFAYLLRAVNAGAKDLEADLRALESRFKLGAYQADHCRNMIAAGEIFFLDAVLVP